MRLSSMSNAFVFNLPSDFLTPEIINNYNPILEKNWVQYETVIDYINSTIKSVSFPGVSYEAPAQSLVRGKKRNYSPAINPQDLSSRELTITFKSVDADLNYWIVLDIFHKHYADTSNIFIKPFKLSVLDVNRDAIYEIHFLEVLAIAVSDNTFNYSMQVINNKEFTMTIKYNFIEIDFLLNKNKMILEDPFRIISER